LQNHKSGRLYMDSVYTRHVVHWQCAHLIQCWRYQVFHCTIRQEPVLVWRVSTGFETDFKSGTVNVPDRTSVRSSSICFFPKKKWPTFRMLIIFTTFDLYHAVKNAWIWIESRLILCQQALKADSTLVVFIYKKYEDINTRNVRS